MFLTVPDQIVKTDVSRVARDRSIEDFMAQIEQADSVEFSRGKPPIHSSPGANKEMLEARE